MEKNASVIVDFANIVWETMSKIDKRIMVFALIVVAYVSVQDAQETIW